MSGREEAVPQTFGVRKRLGFMELHRDAVVETLLLRSLLMLSPAVELRQGLHELTILATKRFRHFPVSSC